MPSETASFIMRYWDEIMLDSITNIIAKMELQIEDLYGESLFITEQGDFAYLDVMRNDLALYHPKIKLINMKYYDLSIYNQCETTNHVLLTTMFTPC